jgi:hypothetical protein
MKVRIVKPKKEKRPRKPKREEYIFRSRKLWETPVGHLAVIDKASFVAFTPMEFKKYLRRMFKGCFAVLTETKTTWIVKRVYASKETQENDSPRRRYYYLPKRASGNSAMGSGKNS